MTYLSDLDPRPCRVCGADTESPVLDTCEAHDTGEYEYDPATASPAEDDDMQDERCRRAIRDMHAMAVDSHAAAVREHLEPGP